jgi:hypothetical protein
VSSRLSKDISESDGLDRVYARRRHRTALRAVVTAGLTCATLLQIVKTKANRLHCQSGPRAPLVTGPG